MDSNVRSSLVWAGLMIASAAGLTALETVGVLPDGGERGFGVVMGLVLGWTGNQMPKWGAGQHCSSDAEAFRMRRFAGIVLMLGGLAHALVWAFAPLGSAAYWSIVPVAVALAIIFAMVIGTRRIV